MADNWIGRTEVLQTGLDFIRHTTDTQTHSLETLKDSGLGIPADASSLALVASLLGTASRLLPPAGTATTFAEGEAVDATMDSPELERVTPTTTNTAATPMNVARMRALMDLEHDSGRIDLSSAASMAPYETCMEVMPDAQVFFFVANTAPDKGNLLRLR